MYSQYLKKLETVIFCLLIFTVPMQARVILHEWTKPFNQWTSAYLYGTDILLAVIFLFWLSRGFGTVKILNLNFINLKSAYFWLVVFFSVSAFSIFNSRIVGLSFYQLIKLAEFIGFYFYLQYNIGKVFNFRTVLGIIIISGFFQSIIAIIQYLKQGSLGLWLLGESPLSVNTTGVAVFFADDVKYLRAYGTAPHPNILAAWLFVSIFAFYYCYLYILRRDNNHSTAFVKECGFFLVYGVLIFGLFFTFSRVIIGLWIFGVLARLLAVFSKKEFRQNKILKRKMLAIFTVSVLVSVLFAVIYWFQVSSRIHITSQEEAVTQRIFYNKIAESTAMSNPVLGVGIGQFVTDFMSKFKHLPAVAYQPVHNIYLLIASETGFMGLGVFVLFLFFIFYNFVRHANFTELRTYSFLVFASSFIVIGLFDHFPWTSQQGGLILWMVLALISMDLSKK